MTAPVCVIITARNAAATVGDAVRSALIQPEVAEVIVVDDASSDETAAAARQAAAGDARLNVLRNDTNLGPAAGRNRAIAASQAPLLAILDADDYFLPGRFAMLLRVGGWEMAADNIAFVPETSGPLQAADLPMTQPGLRALSLAEFAAGNLHRKRATQRGELGFLKPVLSRAFLDRHDLRYDEGLWLGEDFDIYVRMLTKGARFLVSNGCGYVARVRARSLSGQHRTADLGRLLQACRTHLRDPALPEAARNPLARHLDEVRARYLLRSFLDRKAEQGRVEALWFALRPIAHLLPIAQGVLRDKLAGLVPGQDEVPAVRLLLPAGG